MKVVADAGPKGANVTAPIGRTQILVRLHSGNFNFATAKEDGTDLRVVAGDDRTPLHFHIERFDGLVDQVGSAWVDVPDLAPGATTNFFIYWGNKNAPNASDSHATYDADQVLVYHFAEDNGLPHDATRLRQQCDDGGQTRRSGNYRGPAFIWTVRRWFGCRNHPPWPSLRARRATWSMWVKLDKDVNTAVLYSDVDGAKRLYDRESTRASPTRSSRRRMPSHGQPPGRRSTGDGWHFIAVEATDRLTVYVDGQARGDVALTLPALAGQAVLGEASR